MVHSNGKIIGLLVWMLSCNVQYSLCTIPMHNMNALCDIKHEDIDIAFLSAVTMPAGNSTCSDKLWRPAGMQMVEIFRYAINEINTNIDIFRNISVGYVIMDNCLTDVISLAKALSFIRDNTLLAHEMYAGQLNMTQIVPAKQIMDGKKNKHEDNVCLREEIPMFDNVAGMTQPDLSNV